MTQLDRQRIHDKDWDAMAEFAQPQEERTDLEHRTIMRWEDDGGQTIEYQQPADHSASELTSGNNQLMELPAKEHLERLRRG